MALFESYDRRIDNINAVLNQYDIKDIDEAKAICDAAGIDPYTTCVRKHNQSVLKMQHGLTL
jgi:hypothetical protein